MISPTVPENPVERIRHNLVSLRMPRALEALGGVIQQLERGQLGAIEAIDTPARRGDHGARGSPDQGRPADGASGHDQDADGLRLLVPALARPQPHHGLGRPGLRRQARGRPLHRPIRHGEVPPCDRARRRSDPSGAQRVFLPVGRHHRQPGQGRLRGTPARAHPLSLPHPAADHRRDRATSRWAPPPGTCSFSWSTRATNAAL